MNSGFDYWIYYSKPQRTWRSWWELSSQSTACLCAENCGKGVYCLTFWALTCAIVLKLWSDFSKNHPKITNLILLPTWGLTLRGLRHWSCTYSSVPNRYPRYIITVIKSIFPGWNRRSGNQSYIYQVCTINIDLILWHTQLIVCAVK